MYQYRTIEWNAKFRTFRPPLEIMYKLAMGEISEANHLRSRCMF